MRPHNQRERDNVRITAMIIIGGTIIFITIIVMLLEDSQLPIGYGNLDDLATYREVRQGGQD
ncbi:MAG: hypothetical protein OXD46_12990 [Chloroflexi bacterium]|nr:hypothetical protein [Chloroflexota bacterium]